MISPLQRSVNLFGPFPLWGNSLLRRREGRRPDGRGEGCGRGRRFRRTPPMGPGGPAAPRKHPAS